MRVLYMFFIVDCACKADDSWTDGQRAERVG